MENNILATRYRTFYEQDLFYDPSKNLNNDEWNDARRDIIEVYTWIHLLVHTHSLDDTRMRPGVSIPSFEVLYRNDDPFRSFVNVLLANFNTIGRSLRTLIQLILEKKVSPRRQSTVGGKGGSSEPFRDISPLGIIHLLHKVKHKDSVTSNAVVPPNDLDAQLLNMVILGDGMMTDLALENVTFEHAYLSLQTQSSSRVMKIYNTLSNSLSVSDAIVPLLRIGALSQIGRTLLTIKDTVVQNVLHSFQSLMNKSTSQTSAIATSAQKRVNKTVDRVRRISRRLAQVRAAAATSSSSSASSSTNATTTTTDLIQELEGELRTAQVDADEAQRELEQVRRELLTTRNEKDTLERKITALKYAPSMISIQDLSERTQIAERDRDTLAESTRALMQENEITTRKLRELEEELDRLRTQTAERLASAPPAKPLPTTLATAAVAAAKPELTIDAAIRYLVSAGGSSTDFVTKLRNELNANPQFADLVRSALPIRTVSNDDGSNPCATPEGFQSNLGACHQQYLDLSSKRPRFEKLERDFELNKELLISKNLPILEYVSLAEIESQISELVNRLASGENIDQDRLAKLIETKIIHPESKAKDAEATKLLFEKHKERIESAYRLMRTFVPPGPITLDQLKQKYRKFFIPTPTTDEDHAVKSLDKLAEHIHLNKFLRLVRIDPVEIAKFHSSNLENTYGISESLIDLTELLAIHHVVPLVFEKDDDKGSKAKYREKISSLVTSRLKGIAKLTKKELRNPVYIVEQGPFDPDKDEIAPNPVKSELSATVPIQKQPAKTGEQTTRTRLLTVNASLLESIRKKPGGNSEQAEKAASLAPQTAHRPEATEIQTQHQPKALPTGTNGGISSVFKSDLIKKTGGAIEQMHTIRGFSEEASAHQIANIAAQIAKNKKNTDPGPPLSTPPQTQTEPATRQTNSLLAAIQSRRIE